MSAALVCCKGWRDNLAVFPIAAGKRGEAGFLSRPVFRGTGQGALRARGGWEALFKARKKVLLELSPGR